MSEMNHSSRNNENRPEYEYGSEGEKIEELTMITDLMDEIFTTPSNLGASIEDSGRYAVFLESNSEMFGMQRDFSYIETDDENGWAWPLLEKHVSIAYERSKVNLKHERYSIDIDTVVHQVGVSKDPIRRSYDIEYYNDKASANAIVEEVNFGPEKGSYSQREALPYDNGQIFNELASLEGFIASNKADTIHTSQQSE